MPDPVDTARLKNWGLSPTLTYSHTEPTKNTEKIKKHRDHPGTVVPPYRASREEKKTIFLVCLKPNPTNPINSTNAIN